ncbi:MAG TPA: thioredoxin domain-containing protein [Steroidobacteraceae bacterium]|nr:thioredoxin domain-containing protein [Steroidobacteraceae bacterium]
MGNRLSRPSGLRSAAALGLTSILALWARAATSGDLQSADLDAAPIAASQTVVATVEGKRITAAEVAAANRSEFDTLESDYQLRLRQLQARQAQARHELLQQRLAQMLDQRALDSEAKARGTTAATLLAEIKVSVVTDEEVQRFYDENRTRTRDSLEQLRPVITQYLASEHDRQAKRAFYDALRERHGIRSLLGPYRVNVAATGPVRGKDDAPVTIVEFGDFQCPYCREAEDSLRTILGRYPDQVRVVFRNLPLQSLHPNATVAAEAGVCAERQGMFWKMHDAMYQDQSALSEDALKATAKRLGLKVDGFSACLDDPQTRAQLSADRKAADELDVISTPYFFINGRPLNGSVPVERFEAVITDELRRIGTKPDEPKRG